MEKCKKCGKDPEKKKTGHGIYVSCHSSLCWFGPTCQTEEEAENAWDELMRHESAPEKAIRIPFHMCTTDAAIYVLCSDGAIFLKEMNGSVDEKWFELPPIPGTQADMERDLKW